MANTDTAWTTESLVTFKWKFLYDGLYIALELVLKFSFPGVVLSSYCPVGGLSAL